jgi:ribosomal protein L9
MNTADSSRLAATRALHEDLFEIELRVARRADELARTHGSDRQKDVAHWSEAEREIWGTQAGIRDVPAAVGA